MYLLIPIELCSYTITNSFYSPFQLYIHLKSSCSGKTKLMPNDLKTIAESLGFKSEKTVKNNLNILLQNNWVGFNPKSGMYFIRSFNQVMFQNGFTRRAAAEFDTREIKNLNEFLTAAIIKKLINFKVWKLREAERKKGRSRQTSRKFPLFFDIANNYLAKILCISKNKAFRLKENAVETNYRETQKVFVKTDITPNQIEDYLIGYPEVRNKIKVIKKQVYLQGIDKMRSFVLIRRRKKIEPYKKGFRETFKKRNEKRKN